jgi:2',3'-cyclic-nucleotide 2'-phosphodiesterase (5'-nucleotidase family)
VREPPPKSKSSKEDWWLATQAPPYSIVPTSCGRVNIALLGLLSDEKKVFRDQCFRNAPIANVVTTYEQLYQELVSTAQADYVVPMTHMSLGRDQQLAQRMLELLPHHHKAGLIIGGHEHEPMDETVSEGDAYVRILKSGTEAQGATLVDLTFDLDAPQPSLVELEADIVSITPYEPSVVVQKIVHEHMKVLAELDQEVIIHAETLLPPGTPLSSERSRYQQTTVGALLCKAIKDELGVDVAIINGATIKGDTVYENDQISYAAMKKELPFPTKIVVVTMKRWELMEAIQYSRSYSDDGVKLQTQEEKDTIPRRGYLQTDIDFDIDGVPAGAPMLEDTLRVALPRNLMGGFCKILPLMDLGKRLKEEGIYPGPDDFVPAIHLIIRHFSKNLWMDIVGESFTFEEMDLNGDEVLDREEIKIMM